MKVTTEYHDRTPEVGERLAKDITAALRLGLTQLTLTSVPRRNVVDGNLSTAYYFEASLPVAVEDTASGQRAS